MRAFKKEKEVYAIKYEYSGDLDVIGDSYENVDNSIVINTIRGKAVINKGDWIVWDDEGIWFVDSIEFDNQYELVNGNKYKKLPTMIEWEIIGRLRENELDKLLNILDNRDIILNGDSSISDIMCIGYIDILNNTDDLVKNGVAIKGRNGGYFPIEYKVLDDICEIKDKDRKQMQ